MARRSDGAFTPRCVSPFRDPAEFAGIPERDLPPLYRSELRLPLVDLGSAPPSNAYLTEQTLKAPEKWFPLRVLVCEQCWLVQTEDFARAEELFDANYAYFSSFSDSWLLHCRRFVADTADRFRLGADSQVVEIAANDGYLLPSTLRS